MPRYDIPPVGPLWPADKLAENWTRVDARRIAATPVGYQAEPQGREVSIGSTTATIVWLSCGAMFRCPSCDRFSRHIYCGDTYGCFECLGLDYSIRHVDRKWKDLRLVNKWRGYLGAEPFPSPLPPISIHNPRKQRILQRIRIAETRLHTRFQTANQALASFAKAQKRKRRAARGASSGGSVGGSAAL